MGHRAPEQDSRPNDTKNKHSHSRHNRVGLRGKAQTKGSVLCFYTPLSSPNSPPENSAGVSWREITRKQSPRLLHTALPSLEHLV